jgi:multidrug resistance efflux pump
MIGILGARRILTIAILVALNAAVVAMLYLYLTPEKMQKDRELRTARGQISTVTSDIGRMQVEFDQLTVQQERFDKLRAHGFFGSQGRREAERVFEKIQKEAGVISAVANIQAGTIEDNEEAQKAEHKILVSPVNITIEAVDDIDVYRYLYLLEQFFPGHVSIENMTMERKAEITGTVLRAIATGSNPQLVTADIHLTWRTMIPQKDIIGAPIQGAPQ